MNACLRVKANKQWRASPAAFVSMDVQIKPGHDDLN
jgi:hypothetical protein